MDKQLFIGKVHIIEWLRVGDTRTGWELFGEVEPMGIASEPSVEVAFYSIATRDGFCAVLRGIEREFRTTGRLPLLHIETHGSDQGIGISDEEGFTFRELMDELTPLNGLTGLRLLLVMAACEGMWAIKMLQPVTRSAALAVIGPNRRMEDTELARGLQAFYREMFAHRNGDAASRAGTNCRALSIALQRTLPSTLAAEPRRSAPCGADHKSSAETNRPNSRSQTVQN